MTTTVPLTYAEVVATLAGHLADRDAFVVIAATDQAPAVAQCLSTLPSWNAYLVNNSAVILRVDDPNLVMLANVVSGALGIMSGAVFTVPKTVTAASLGKALQTEIAEDGSQDILNLQAGRNVMAWPTVFVDALARIDPKLAANLRAGELSNLS